MDHARPHHRADGSSTFEVAGASRSPATGSTTPTASSRPRSASPTSRTGTAAPVGKHTPWGDEDTPALVTAVETALERELSGHDHAVGRPSPKIRTLKQGDARSPSRATTGNELLPAARRRAGGRGRRRGGGRGRARAPSWASGPCSRAAAHLDAAGPDAGPGGRRPVPIRLDRTALAEVGRRAPTGGRWRPVLRVRLAFLGVRGLHPGARRPSSPRWAATPRAWPSAPTTSRPRLVLDAGTGLRRLTGLLAGGRSRDDPADPPALGPPPGPALLRGRRPRRRRVRSRACPTRASPDAGAAPRHVAAALPDRAGRPARALDLRRRWQPGRHRSRASRSLALQVAHKGGLTFGYRVERRRRPPSPTCPTTPDRSRMSRPPGGRRRSSSRASTC